MLDRVVDYIWDRKIRFLISIAALFFAINGITAAVQSFREPLAPLEITNVPAARATSTIESHTEATTSVQTTTKPVTKPASTQTQVLSTSHVVVQTNLPNRLVIARIGVDVRVSNPLSTNINVLNDELTRTVVRYTGSGTMTQGNMLIMGHSSELPIVRNPLYKVFSQLKYLVAGDVITVYSDATTNTYRVTSVNMLNINDDEAYIPFSSQNNKLTLVTCNVRGEKDERYIVEAELIASN
jgi:LPXTG-site transpeptidase (sortase) family protein